MINIAICDDEKKDIVHLKSILQEVMDKYSMSYDIQEYESGESLMQTASLFHLIFIGFKQSDSGQLSSYAARFELESSTAALRQFSEKFVPEDMRESFSNLIDQYYEHNAKILEGYRSSREISNELLAALYDSTASQRVIPMDEEEKNIQKAGKVKVEESDITNATESWREHFKMLVNGEKSVDDSITMMRETLNALASGSSKNQSLLQYVSRWNSFSIENARNYWNLLL